MDATLEGDIARAAEAIVSADALLIAAGAGMGVDSGLPDFRGVHGFWQAYPPYAKLGLDFVSLANPALFESDPALAWGFYGHRLGLYRRIRPHEGFDILQRWAAGMGLGAFVFTSNVDGHFQRAGFDPQRVVEVHGAIDWMQCTRRCGIGHFPADPFEVQVEESTFRASDPLPACPECGGLARPAILMFGDFDWDSARSAAQYERFGAWMASMEGSRLVIIECGAGTAVPTVRRFSEQTVQRTSATLIRINPREPEIPQGQISLPMRALDALLALEARMTLP